MSDHTPGTERNADAFANQDDILLSVLTAIERDANTSQRNISREIGIALGLANAYLKRCARKGLIKIQQVPRRRYAYYLTPKGFAEKARLTGEYLSASLTFFRRARIQISDLIANCTSKGWTKIAIAGISELSEIAILCGQDHNITFAAVISQANAGEYFHGLPVVATAAECGKIDAVIVTALVNPAELFCAIEKEIGAGRVLAPPLLRLDQRRTDDGAAERTAR